MPRRILILIAFLLAFLGAVLMVTLRRQPPVIPADQDHLDSRGNQDACISCHSPAGRHPRGPNHPFGSECWNCHFEAEGAR